jgi:hypothetical protein
MPSIYTYFNSKGEQVTQTESDVRTWLPPEQGDEMKNEGLAAIFQMAESVQKGGFPLERARTVSGVQINDTSLSISDLANYVKEGNFSIGSSIDIQLILSLEDPPRDAMDIISNVFPAFRMDK